MVLDCELIGCDLRVGVGGPYSSRSASTRGVCRGAQTRFSSSRLRRALAQLTPLFESVRLNLYFVTLTYRPDSIPPPGMVYSNLRSYLDRLRRAGCAAVWRVEYTRRGVAHYHLIVYAPVVTAIPVWQYGRYQVESCRSVRGSLSYIAGEFSKRGQASFDQHVGRWWGIVNRAVFFRPSPISFRIHILVWYRMRRVWRRLRRYRPGRFCGRLLWFDTHNFRKFFDFFCQGLDNPQILWYNTGGGT